ncbi:MAG TPA: HEAT repeat domain-containing protein, partial [bacterium]|nr:HEAT repeat domain-containing protein [bacterium]
LFSETDKQTIVQTLDRAGLFDKFIAKFWEINSVRQVDLLAMLKYTFMETHVDFLRSCLAHPNTEISSQALLLLAKLKSGLQQGDFAKALGSQNPETVLSAVAILSEEGTVESLPAIVPLLNHTSEEVARHAALCVARISERQLFSRFDSLGDKVLERIAKTLHRLNPNLISDISAKLDSLSGKEKAKSVRILLSLSTEQEAREALETLMEDENAHVRASAAKGVSGFSSDEVAGILDKLLQDEDPRVRANAIEEIAGSPNQRVVQMLFQSARSRHGRERANALKKLWELGYRGYELSVAQMIEDPDPYIRASGLWVVGEIEAPSLMKLVQDRLSDPQPIVRRSAVNAIRRKAESNQVRTLFPLLKDPDESVRHAVNMALKERLNLEMAPGHEPEQTGQ